MRTNFDIFFFHLLFMPTICLSSIYALSFQVSYSLYLFEYIFHIMFSIFFFLFNLELLIDFILTRNNNLVR